jgi:hypothetical protein
MAYTAVTVEGGIFPADALDRLASGEGDGQRAQDFGLDGGRLSDEIQSAFSDARSFWDFFVRRRAHSRESATTLTREAWVIPLLERLGYDLAFQRAGAQAGGEIYPISHRAGQDPDAPPVHIVAIDQPLDRRGDGARRSPHALVQEYLNRADDLWGLVTNGEKLRLLRDSVRLSRPTYLEFDLPAIVEGNLYSEFVLLYRLLQCSRLPRTAADGQSCLLERYYQQGIDEGGRVRENLRDGVEQALKELGTAFLVHPESVELRQALRLGRLDIGGYYRQLLRLVYRLLFLMVVEERKLVFPPTAEHAARQPIYTLYYSIGRLRDRCERYFAEDRDTDLWQGLLQTFLLFRDDDAARQLGMAALNGELFGPLACADLEGAVCENSRLLRALYHLSTFADGKVRRRVNYAALDVEELGSIYESLLEFHPHADLDGTPGFDLLAGSERKQTGSYYTPPDLVRELIGSALVPVMEDRLKGARTRDEQEATLLGMRVCDPASGSGHFLLAAARRIARELARVRTGEAEPTPEAYRAAVRDVIGHCIYAVDKNPLAVDLCKVALWIEGYNAGLPLSFLDHHVKCGDSLVGVFDLAVLAKGIPDEAYAAVTGDDKKAASSYKKENKKQREGQLSLFATSPELPATLAGEFQALAAFNERTPADVHAKEELYTALRTGGSRWWTLKVACDLWTAAFFAPLRPLEDVQQDLVPTTDTVRGYLAQPAASGQLVAQAMALSQEHPFFHWPLEFPDVFVKGGFDVVLGNPPWERIKLQEEEFFAGRDRDIAQAPNKAEREKLIRTLSTRNPALAGEFTGAKHNAEAQGKFVRGSDRYPLCGRGDVNTYAIFAETIQGIQGPSGRAGAIVPTGIATDDTTKFFFRSLMDERALASLIDFENREGIFPGVHRSYKFCLLTLTGQMRPATQGATFTFFALRMDDLRDEARRFTLSAEDIALLNPNTHTCPIFRSRRDTELTKSIYRRVPVLVNEARNENPWGLRFLAMFHMSNDSRLFQSIVGPDLVPLYEGKMVQAFDHRAASVETVVTNLKRPGQPRSTAQVDYRDPWYSPTPQYWIPRNEVLQRVGKRRYLIAFKRITSSTNERTVVSALLPLVGASDSLFILLLGEEIVPEQYAAAVADLNSMVLDYAAKQKVGGLNLSYFYVKQFPFLHPATYTSADLEFIVPRVLELSYTAWDIQPFALDLGYQGPPFAWDAQRRFQLRCELDAYYFHLYGIARDDVAYIMDAFPIVKREDESRLGEYLTKRVILELYDSLMEVQAQQHDSVIWPA